jgi:hypothetical protein
MVDEGTMFLENMVGAAFAETGLRAIEDFYTLTGDDAAAATIRANLQAVTTPPEERTREDRAAGRAVEVESARQRAVETAQDERRRRAERWEALNALSVAPCTNAREMLFGHSAGLEAAFASAQANLARFPGEHRLLSNMRTFTPPDPVQGLLPLAISGAGRLAGWVFGNKRMGSCTTIHLAAP